MINFKQVLNKKNDPNNSGKTLSEAAKGNLTAAAIGTGVGLALASINGKSLSLYGGIGALIGLTLMYITKPKKQS